MSLNPALDSLLIAEALKAASLDDIAAELRRRAKVCDEMGNDCGRFADAEEDPVRVDTYHEAAGVLYIKAENYRDAAREVDLVPR